MNHQAWNAITDFIEAQPLGEGEIFEGETAQSLYAGIESTGVEVRFSESDLEQYMALRKAKPRTMSDVIDAYPDGVFMPLYTLDRYSQREYRAYARGARILREPVTAVERTVPSLDGEKSKTVVCVETTRDRSSHTSVNIWPAS